MTYQSAKELCLLLAPNVGERFRDLRYHTAMTVVEVGLGVNRQWCVTTRFDKPSPLKAGTHVGFPAIAVDTTMANTVGVCYMLETWWDELFKGRIVGADEGDRLDELLGSEGRGIVDFGS